MSLALHLLALLLDLRLHRRALAPLRLVRLHQKPRLPVEFLLQLRVPRLLRLRHRHARLRLRNRLRQSLQRHVHAAQILLQSAILRL